MPMDGSTLTIIAVLVSSNAVLYYKIARLEEAVKFLKWEIERLNRKGCGK